MKMMLCRVEDEKSVQEQSLRSLTKSRKHYQARAEVLQQQLVEATHAHADFVSQTQLKPNRNITTFGGYSLALRRNIAHVSQKAVAAIVTKDTAATNEVLDKKSVGTYEHRLALAKTLRSIEIYGDASPLDLEVAPADDCRVEVHEYKGDATNQEAIERSKVHVSMITSSKFDAGSLRGCHIWVSRLASLGCTRVRLR